ncbi:putative Nuclear mRNA splicing factor [Taphrina deformans PYCC 5710]|uniref:DNA damage-binding protein 1 n=1 Tax=Taphrina deformans (strain PYCC 5710 / ATCC 11124 / CBS 356.35 / IMI 108563 / JCM 9778 / NBRC 8474) TaxID=1097556 RepID=R4XDQ3_TAPDE|nr:putative Nuclear mRNA splicing factor [Taphrina deformans PYCC 5710]|eukprot:CCG81469.1 putative Nuclear mRNA splicing factor [Taphrina deformans PYCC 5710]
MSTHGSSAFYSLSLVQPSSPVCNPIVGQFAGNKQQEVIVATSNALTVYKIDSETGKFVKLYYHEVFGIIRSLAQFRLTGSTKDYILLGTESGKITVLEYQSDPKNFVKVHQETFGKSGVRRVVPGEFMAVDPKGRTVMIAAVEKNKLVYVLNRDAAANLTISSPLEASSPSSLLFHVVGLDVGYDNPVFASLEVNYADADQDASGQAYRSVQKTLTYYELDLGLNHVVREWTELVDRKSNMLIPVPGGYDGPSGVLVCCPDSIIYKHKGRRSHRLPIPRRRGAYEDPSHARTIVASVTHRLRGGFFLLVQTSDGDLFKITIEHADGELLSMMIKYFDTVPVATGLTIFKSGYLYTSTELGDQNLYQFEKLGEDDNETEFQSVEYDMIDDDPQPVYFHPRPLVNLTLVDQIKTLNPLTHASVLNLTNEDAPQIYAACGRGPRSTLKTIRHGLEVTEQVASELPGKPIAVWTTKLTADDRFDSYIILSFTDGTLVLSIGETVEEVTDTGFLASATTLAVQQLGEDALIQVHPKGIRHIRADKRVNEWQAPQHRTIVQATTNARQVVVALSSGELVYFEMDSDGQLNEYQDKKEMSGNVTALSVGSVPVGRQRNPYLAVACDDSTVRIISLDPDSTLDSLSVQALTAPASSLSMMSMDDGMTSTLYLHIGLYNGTYIRTVLESTTGQLVDTRTRFLGPSPIKLFSITAQEQTAVLALCTRPWLGYIHNFSMQLNPLLGYDALEHAHSFSSDQCPEGVVAIQGASLVIFTVDRLDDKLKADSHQLDYTPRKFTKHPTSQYLYIVEADHHVMTSNARSQAVKGKQNGDAQELDPLNFGRPWAKAGSWGSCIRAFDPVAQQTVAKIELEDDEAAFCVTVVPFSSREDELYLAVGTAKGATVSPKSCKQAYILLYKLVDGGRSLEFVHRTETSEIPLSMLAFQGRLLVAVGGNARLYDIGRKRCLRKSETQVTENAIVGMHTQGDRVVLADNVESVYYAVYKQAENRLICFANDTISRATTASTMVDYETVAGGDRFGNIWIVRCPADASELSDTDTTGNTLVHEKPYLQGTAHRLDTVAHYFLGDTPTSIQKCTFVAGGRSVLMITGLMGSISLLIPFVAKEDVEFFQQLETHMRSEDAPLGGRDHLMYRGYYAPPKSVIDGDLCERFVLLSLDKQRLIAGELDREVAEVKAKLENMRIRNAL